MRYRTFGRLGWQVGEVGYGMWGIGGWTGSDDRESFASLELALSRASTSSTPPRPTATATASSCSACSMPGTRPAIYGATKVPPKNRQWPPARHAARESSRATSASTRR